MTRNVIQSKRPSHRASERGFFMLDAVTGLLLMLVTLALLGSITARSRIVARRLADDRAAVRLAEATLLALNNQGAATKEDRVDVQILQGAAPSGHHWANVVATVNSRRVEIIGLVPTTQPATEVPP